MSSPSAPTPPDPVATAKAQGDMNEQTAITQYGLNATDQVTPYGNLSYSQGGNWQDGTPHYTATQTLSPEQQKLYDLNTQTQQGIGQIGLDQTKRIADVLSSPVDLSNGATEGRLIDLGRRRLDPIMDQRWAGEENRLYNQGVMPGTEAYNRAKMEFERSRNDATDQLLLSGRGQAVQEALTQRNQPINEITALLRGSGVQQPSFTNTPQSNVAPVDYAGLVSNNYAGQMAAYNADQQKQGAMFGALGSLGGMALGGWGSSGFKKPSFFG